VNHAIITVSCQSASVCFINYSSKTHASPHVMYGLLGFDFALIISGPRKI